MLIKYHGDGDPDALVANLELQEMQEVIELNGSDKRWWDFRELGNTAAARYRLYMVILMSFFGQWSGNNVSLSFSLTSRDSPTDTP